MKLTNKPGPHHENLTLVNNFEWLIETILMEGAIPDIGRQGKAWLADQHWVFGQHCKCLEGGWKTRGPLKSLPP